MAQYTEVSRRSMYHEETVMANDPVSVTTIDAEIVVEKDGKKIYLHALWSDKDGDEISYEATEESIYDLCEKLKEVGKYEVMELINWLEEFNRRRGKRIEEDSCFEEYYKELEQMVLAEMKTHGRESEIK